MSDDTGPRRAPGPRKRGVIVTVQEAKVHLSKLLGRVSQGEEIVIERAGRPVARLVPVSRPTRSRVAGSARGKVKISPDLDTPLPDDILRAFEE